MQEQDRTIDYKDKTVYVEIDTHLKSWKVGIGLEHTTQKTFGQSSDPKQLYNYLTKH